MNSPQNPLQVQVVVDDANGTELAIDLAVKIGLGGNKATVTIPTVANDTRVSLDVWGGKFSKENRFKHTMIIFNDPKLRLTDVLDNGTGLVSIPDSFSDPSLRAGVPGPQGDRGTTGPQGAPGPVGATPTSMPGTSITSPVNESKMLDNSNQTLNLGGASGANVTLTAPNSGNINVTLPSNSGTLATTTGLTPIAVDPFAADLEGVTTVNGTNLNYINITDSNTTTTDTLQSIVGGSKGQEIIIELEEDINFYADNLMTKDTIQWGRGTGVGVTLPGTANEIFRFLYNGQAWFLIERFTL